MINKNNHQMLPVSGQSAAKMTFFRLAGLMLVIAAVLISPSICSASVANAYIAQNATGAANGADCADALPLTWVNNSSNWGSGANQVGPGSTVHLCGTITAATNGNLLSLQGSGSNGHPVTVLFESGAILTSPQFSLFGGAIATNGQSWITIDGGVNGIIQNTANGSGLANAAGSRPIYVSGPATGVTIKNLTIANVCQHTDVNDHVGCQTGGNGGAGIWVQGGSTGFTATNNTIHDVEQGILYVSATGDSGTKITNNTISRSNWEISIAPIGIWSGLLIDGNDISCVVGAPCNWNDGVADNFHHNGIMIDPQGTGDIGSGIIISNNFIHDINTCTAGIFLDPASGDVPNVKIYNNVFYTSPGQIGPSDGWVTVGIGTTNTLVANNTILGPGGAGLNAQVGPTIENNIFANISWGELLNAGYTGVVSDYNSWYNLAPGDAMAAGSIFYANVADWVAGTGFDTHSITVNPNLTSTFVPSSASPVIGKGINLTSLGIPGLNASAPQKFGAGGSCGSGCVPRPSSGSWDMGAYQHSSGTSTPVAPASGLAATAH